MGLQANNDSLITRFLLGELSEQERRQLEEQFFADDSSFELILAVEDELLDAYVQGELSTREHERFETYYLNSPQRRQRVEFARLLSQHVSNQAAKDILFGHPQRGHWWQAIPAFLRSQNPAVQFALTAVLLVTVGLILWTALRQHRPPALEREARRETRPDAQDSPTGTHEQMANSQQDVNSGQHMPATIVLTPGSFRSMEQSNTLSISQGTEQVRLQLYLESNDYKNYRAELFRVEDRSVPVWQQEGLASQSTDSARSVVLNIPANRFSTGDYKLMLSGITLNQEVEAVADYNFKVVRK